MSKKYFNIYLKILLKEIYIIHFAINISYIVFFFSPFLYFSSFFYYDYYFFFWFF
jgi:hypothetical protein